MTLENLDTNLFKVETMKLTSTKTNLFTYCGYYDIKSKIK